MLNTRATVPSRPERRTVRFPCFDGYRAVAAMTVLVTHVSFITVANHFSVLGPYFARFDIGVAFFFLISGFLLYRPFVVAALAGDSLPNPGSYARRRLLRIVPAYWLALTVALFVFRVQPHLHWGDLPFFYGFAQIYDANHIVGGLTPAWTLDVEVSFYAFVPAWAWLTTRIRRDQRVVQLAGVVVLYATSLLWRMWVLTPGWGFHAGPFTVASGNALTWLPAALDYFALGMLLAIVNADGRLRVPDLPWLWWALGALSLWIVSRHIGLPLDLHPYGYARLFERQALYGLVAFFVLIPGVFGDQRRGASRRVLQWPAVVWLGTISYGIYLWHEQWIQPVQQLFGWHAFGGHFGPTLLAVTVGSVVSAGLSYHLFEKQVLKYK